MIASSSIAGRLPPASITIDRTGVPWLVLAPVVGGIALMPFLKPSGPGNSSPVDVFIALSIGITLLWAGYTRQELRFPYAFAIALIMIGGAVASLAGPLPATGLLAVSQDLVVLSWCAVIVNVARSAGAFRWLLRAWAYGSVAWALLLIGAIATGNLALAGVTARTGVRASLTFGDPNYAANYFFVSLMVVIATRTPRRRILRLLACGALLVALGLTGSNGGLLACAVGLTIVAISVAYRHLGPIPLVAAVCAVGVLGVITLTAIQTLPIEEWAKNSGQPLLRDSIGRSSQSAQERVWLIEETTNLFKQGVPWGLGPGSTKPLLLSSLAPYAYETHDDYIESMVERGVLGAFGLLFLIGSLTVRTWTVATKPLAAEFADLFPTRAALVGAVLGLAVSASYYQVLHFRHVWAMFAIVAALYVWGRK